MHKILSKEFETSDLLNHLKKCDICQKEIEKILNDLVSVKPYGALALNIFKLIKGKE